MSKNEHQIPEERIQQILIKKAEWHSGMLPYMTDAQLADVLEDILSKTLHSIIHYKKMLGHETFIDDIARNQMFHAVHKEIKSRLLEKDNSNRPILKVMRK